MRANSYFKDLTGLVDDGFQNLILKDKLRILEPDGSRVSHWTGPIPEGASSAAAAAVSPPTRGAHKASAAPAAVSHHTRVSPPTRGAHKTSAAAAAVSPPTRGGHKESIPADFNARIKLAFAECNLDMKRRGLFAFVERVAKIYHAKLGPPPKQGRRMYLDRSEKTRDAVSTTIEDYLKLPYMCDVDETTEIMIPVLEVIFQMPAKGPPRGSQAWLRLQLQELSVVSYADLDKFPQLLRAYDKREVI